MQRDVSNYQEEIDPFRVVVPYAGFHKLAAARATAQSRYFYRFYTRVAAFRCMQRKTREGVVFANIRDFDDAVALYHHCPKLKQANLLERDWLVFQAIFDNGKSATMKELVESLKPSPLVILHDS